MEMWSNLGWKYVTLLIGDGTVVGNGCIYHTNESFFRVEITCLHERVQKMSIIPNSKVKAKPLGEES